MPMRVCELVAVPSLDLRVVVDGDLERVIRWVHTTELADPSRYLQGGEVILTTGVWRDAGTSSADFVAPLRRSDVAALGYGLPEPDAVMPPDLEHTCAAAGLPLFAVPYDVPFIAVSRAFVDRVYGQREESLRERVLRNDRLVEAAGHGAGLDGILGVLDPRLRAWMLGRGRRVIAGTAMSADAHAVSAQAAGFPQPRPVAVNGWLAFPIVALGRTEAHLVVASGRKGLADDDRAAVDQTLPFLGLELARLQALRENERRLAAELVDLILAGPAQHRATAARLATFGLDAGAPMAAIVCESEDPDVGLDRLERALAEVEVAAVAAVKARELVAVAAWPGDEAGLATLAAGLHERVEEPVGVGGLAADASGLRAAIVAGPPCMPVRGHAPRRRVGDAPPGGVTFAADCTAGRGGARSVPASAPAPPRGARRPPPVAPGRDARPLPVVGLPLAGHGVRAPCAREHPPPSPEPGRAADGPRPGLDGRPRRPLYRAALPPLSQTGPDPVWRVQPTSSGSSYQRTLSPTRFRIFQRLDFDAASIASQSRSSRGSTTARMSGPKSSPASA